MLNNQTNENEISRKTLKIAARSLICFMMALLLVIPMGESMSAYAAEESSNTSYRQNISQINIAFKTPTITDSRLSQHPCGLSAAGQYNSIKLTWSGVSNRSGIDGYVIIRRDADGRLWREIAKVNRNTTTYTDKSDITKNVFYFYTVVAFKKSGSTQKVSTAAAWGGAVTSWSNKNNAYEIKYTNDANIVSIMKGSCAQALVKYPNNSYSTYTRWWSSNTRVAKVNSKGQITGVSVGRARIYAKTPSGINNGITVNITKPGTAQAMITTFKAWEGYSRINGKQNAIIDIYNSVTPWPAGYRMRYSDAWCDATVSAAAIKTGNATRIGRECGVPRHIDIFKKLGIWEEDGTIRPTPGDIIVFSWNRWSQPNNASASHIGIVEKVVGNTIYTIEGNRGIGVVGTREIPIGWGCIRGYARPRYAK